MKSLGLPSFTGVFDHLIVHATATPPSLDVDAAWVDRVHRQQGWSGCGYHFVIKRDGTLEWEGTGARTRPLNQVGAHVGGCGPGWNARSVGITMAGGVKEDGVTADDNFTDAQYDTLWAFINQATEAFDIPWANVMGHRDLIKLTNAAPKACPCFSVAAWIEARQKEATGQETTPLHELDQMDSYRRVYDWLRKLRPALKRGDPLKVVAYYTVQPGDTLWKISNVTGVRISDIQTLNNMETDVIVPGQVLRLLN